MTTPTDAPRPALGELARLATGLGTALTLSKLERELAISIAEYDARPKGGQHVGMPSLTVRLTVGNAKNLLTHLQRCPHAVILQLVALATGGATGAQTVELRCSGCTVTARVADGVEGFTHHCGGVFRRAARSLTPERPADA